MPDVDETLETALGSPKSATVGGNTVTQRDISEVIEADKYLKAREAATSSTPRIRFNRLVPPGSV